MDKFIINIPVSNIDEKGIVVRIDGEAATCLANITSQTGASNKFIVSEMIKFCYERLEINQVKIGFKDM